MSIVTRITLTEKTDGISLLRIWSNLSGVTAGDILKTGAGHAVCAGEYYQNVDIHSNRYTAFALKAALLAELARIATIVKADPCISWTHFDGSHSLATLGKAEVNHT